MTTAGGVSSRGVLAFADRLDVLLVALGTLGAVADGCSYNLLLAFASDAVNSLGRAHGAAAQQQGGATTTSDGARFVHDVDKSCLNFVYLALAVLPVAFLEGYCWSRASERQVRRIRRLYLQAMLRQEPGFFDSGDAAGTAEIIGGISKDASVIRAPPRGRHPPPRSTHGVENGWSLDALTKMLTVKKAKAQTNQKLDASKLQRLTECIFHLEH